MRNSTKFGTTALLLILTLSIAAAREADALSYWTTWNPFTSNFDYYTLYDGTDNITAACLNLSGDLRCAWPAGGAGSAYTFTQPIYNNTATNVMFNGSAANVNNSNTTNYWAGLSSIPSTWANQTANDVQCVDCVTAEDIGLIGSCSNICTESLEADTLQTVTTRGAITTTNLTAEEILAKLSCTKLYNGTDADFCIDKDTFAGNTTDNLAQGSTNLYDNKTFNETRTGALYIRLDNTTVSSWNSWFNNYTACTSGQKLYFNGHSLACNNDVDTNTWNSTAEIFGVCNNGTFAPIAEPVWSANYTACSSTQKLYFNGRSLACANDIDTNTYNTTQEMFNAANNGSFVATMNTSIPTWNAAYSYATNNSFIKTLNSSVLTWDRAYLYTTNGTFLQSYYNSSYDAAFKYATNGTFVNSLNSSIPQWANRTALDVACAVNSLMLGGGTCVDPAAWDRIESDDLYLNGTRALTANWDVGAFNLTANGLKLGDNEKLYMGTADNGTMYYNGSATIITGPTSRIELL